MSCCALKATFLCCRPEQMENHFSLPHSNDIVDHWRWRLLLFACRLLIDDFYQVEQAACCALAADRP